VIKTKERRREYRKVKISGAMKQQHVANE